LPFSTQKQILQAGVGIILISEHSFFLCQQNNPQPFSSAIQKYKASGLHHRVKKVLEEEVFKQYNKATPDQKVDMIIKVIV
ncbi:hypothetical protein EV363DRAFT_1107992, partial [Boletus edulis]